MQTETLTVERTYGHVRVTRVISDDRHGNVQAERVIPVVVEGDDPTLEAIHQAEHEAWLDAHNQVTAAINEQFERQWLPAPIYSGPRYNVLIWRPDRHILLIAPRALKVPGGTLQWRFGEGDNHRLVAARKIAERIVARHPEITDCWDFCDGDFTALEKRLAEIEAERAIEQEPEQHDDDGEF